MNHTTLVGCLALLIPALSAHADPVPGRASAAPSPVLTAIDDVPRPIRCAAPCDRPVCPPPPCADVAPPCPCSCVPRLFDEYVPVVPIGPSRTMHTTLVMPPVPWLLTDGEAGTPARGRVAFNLSRLSDERRYTDNRANRFEFDGEEEIGTLEVVSPRMCAQVFGRSIGFHLAGSLTAHTSEYAWFAGLRNWVENHIASADGAVNDSHDLLGRELSITDGSGTKTDLLGLTPLWKARVALKVPLPDVEVGTRRLSSAWSLGVTPPAFGNHADSGNESVAVDTTLAWALPLSEHWRLTGAFNLALPGKSATLDRFGIDHQTLVGGGIVSVEWWASHSFAVALGATLNGPYTRDGDAPTDLTSFYLHLGLLWRPSEHGEIHILFAENPGTLIATDGTPNSDYTWVTQRDADFSLTFGGSLEF